MSRCVLAFHFLSFPFLSNMNHPLVVCGLLVVGFAVALAIDMAIAKALMAEYGTVSGGLMFMFI